MKFNHYNSNAAQLTAKTRRRGQFFFCFLAVALIGCGHSSDVAVPRPTVPAGTGIVRGVVKFIGTVPPVRQIDGDCCGQAASVMDESLMVNSEGSLKNVVVYIKDGPNVATAFQDMVLTQKNCQYVPHVLGIQAGQNLVVTSHDATMHNVHIEADANPAQNFSESQNASRTVHFDRPELVRFKCDVHPWMTAYAYVFDHPCFAVTDENGKFEIRNLPPGKYTLVAWQEKLQSQEMQVTVTADKPGEVTVEYREQ